MHIFLTASILINHLCLKRLILIIRSLCRSRMKFILYISGLMMTSAIIYHAMNFFHLTIDVRNVCVFLAPLFSSFTTIVTYFFTRELKVCLSLSLKICSLSPIIYPSDNWINKYSCKETMICWDWIYISKARMHD